MRRGIFLIGAFLAIVNFSCAENETPGWTDLFNGTDLEGWEVMNGDATFRVEEGAITGITKMHTPNTFLATKKEYGDFILEYEAKVDPELNAGVQIRSHSLPEYQDGRVHGYQVELDPSARAWTGGIYDEARRGWLYNLECNPEAKLAFKQNAWNLFRVEALGSNIRVWLNGVPASDIIDDMTPKGFIALQVHSIEQEKLAGKTVQYRNIRIKTDQLDTERTKEKGSIPQNSYLTNTLTSREISEGWNLLWDGITSNGWRGARLDHFPKEGWVMKNGILTVVSSGGGESEHGGDIVTVKKYENFVLEVDFKYTRGANSGIKYFVDTDLNKGQGSAIGCEYQILDDDVHPDAKEGVNGNRTLASLYDLITANAHLYAPDESTSKRVNHYGWNRARIDIRDDKVEHYLNGIKVVEYDRSGHMWKALVAYSKYKVWPEFGEARLGHILLQDHGDQVSFKNIKIREIKSL
jgi:hypothetical protein